MMRRAYIITIIALATMLTGCSTTTQENTDNEVKNIEITQEQATEYYNAVVDILDSKSIQELKDRNNESINESLYESLAVLYSVEEGEAVGSNDVGLDVDPGVDGGSEQDDQGNYPIIDQYGTIYRYGTQEESEASYEQYNSLPEYEMLGYSVSNNSLRIKIFLREYRVSHSYIVKIGEDGTIIQFDVA